METSKRGQQLMLAIPIFNTKDIQVPPYDSESLYHYFYKTSYKRGVTHVI